MLHFECKHSTLQNHKTNKHEKGLEFQTEPNPARDLSTANPTTLPPGLAFFKQENVNMVIFSTCSKTDRFSQAGRKKKEKQAHTRSQASPHLLCVPVWFCRDVLCGLILFANRPTQIFHTPKPHLGQ